MTNSALGRVHTNFDAETRKEELREADYSRILRMGLSWSETFQASNHDKPDTTDIEALLEKCGDKLSLNLVIGNAAYGFEPSFSALEEISLKLASWNGKIKLGAEGSINGRKVINLAAKLGASSYILKTPVMDELIRYANSKRVPSLVYAPFRISDSRKNAANELLGLLGNGYLLRRGVLPEEISAKLGNYALYGTGSEVVEQIKSILANGPKKVVLCPTFGNYKDLTKQLTLLSNCVE